MRVGLIGSGNMARAMARGWGDPVLCSDSGSGRAQALADELGGRAAGNAEVAAEADLVILCHKPYQLGQVAAEIADQVKAVVSVLGGISTGKLRSAYKGAQVFRLIPNTPVEVCRGISAYAPYSDHDGYIDRRRARASGRRAVRATRHGGHDRGEAAGRRPGGVERRAGLPGPVAGGPGRRGGAPRPQARRGRPARRRDDGGHRGAAADPRLRHPDRPARGHLAGRLDRPGTRCPGARRDPGGLLRCDGRRAAGGQ